MKSAVAINAASNKALKPNGKGVRMDKKRILLVITGSIAAYKALDLIRLLQKAHYEVQCILSKGGSAFITPLSIAALSGKEVYTDLFSLKDEVEMGHIRLAREADHIIVAPASANMIAKMAHGMADDLASATLLAANVPIAIVPAMNAQMYNNPAVQRNLVQLKQDGVQVIGPAKGELACKEEGEGRMVEPEEILEALAVATTRGQD